MVDKRRQDIAVALSPVEGGTRSGWPALLLQQGFPAEEDGCAIVTGVLGSFSAVERNAPWLTYWGIDTATGHPVGICGFKADADEKGVVEIGYFTFPNHEGCRVASNMAAGLLEIARRGAAVRVLAHTLPETNASVAVLLRLGFQRAGIVEDPEDGPVWVWSKIIEPQGH